MRIALHACCGPCLLEPFDALSAEADEIVIVYANPNIHPVEEYERRRDTLREYAAASEISVVELEYDVTSWLETAGVVASDRNARCRACYRLRLSMTAEWASKNGFDAVATTLSVSPYQMPEAIAEEGTRAARAYGIEFMVRDYRERYPEATRRSRELGMYRQNYCGCIVSQLEARDQREQRRRERAERKRSGQG